MSARRKRVLAAVLTILGLALLVLAPLPFLLRPSLRFYTDGTDLREPAGGVVLRQVLWETPLPLPPEINRPDLDEYEPRVSPDGELLVFTRGRPGENAELWAARREGARWGSPRPLAELNSPADELSASFSPGGSALFFSSNRAGGQGGLDLWVSERKGDRWGEPLNLGQAVNGPFHELSPVVGPGARALYFSSDRAAGEEQGPWRATLREMRRRGDYDIYASPLAALIPGAGALDGAARPLPEGPLPEGPLPEGPLPEGPLPEGPLPDGSLPDGAAPDGPLMEVARGRWPDLLGAPVPVAAVNRAGSSEGAVAFSPRGEFLYFSSDRPGGAGGFDLFRARLRGGVPGEPEPLGSPVNSPSDDLDPALDAGGFRLHFSRTRDGREDLLVASSREVYLEAEPGEPYLSLAPLLAFLRAIHPLILGLLLSLLVCMVLLFLLHRRLGTLNLLGRCFLLAILLHLVLLMWMHRTEVKRALMIAHAPEKEAGLEVLAAGEAPAEDVGEAIREEIAELAPEDSLAALAARVPAPLSGTPAAPAPPALEALLVPLPEPGLPPPVAPLPEAFPAPVPLPREEIERAAPREETAPPLLAGRAPSLPEEPPSVFDEAVPRPQPVAPAAALAPAAREDAPGDPRDGARLAAAVPPPAAEPVPLVREARRIVLVPPEPLEASPLPPVTEPPPPGIAAPRAAEEALPAAADGAVRPAGTLPAAGPRRPEAVAAPAAESLLRPLAPPGPAAGEPAAATAHVPAPAPERPSPLVHRLESGAPAGSTLPRAADPQPPSLPRRAAAPAAEAEPSPEGAAPRLLTGPVGPRPSGEGTGGASAPALDLLVPRPPERRKGSSGAAAPLRSVTGEERPSASPGPGDLRTAVGRLLLPESGAGVPGKAGPPAAPAGTFLPRLYELRERSGRTQVLRAGGGSEATEKAVERGLSWLALHQSPDGRWSLRDYTRHLPRPSPRDLRHPSPDGRLRDSRGGRGNARNGDTAATGLALLAFLGHGDGHREAGPHRESVARGLEWLLGAQGEDGDLRGGGNLYMHAIASFALCEAYAFTRDPALRGPAQRAIDFTTEAQHPVLGGWRYQPYPLSSDADTSVFGWMLMALKSGSLGGLKLDPRCLELATRYLDSARFSRGGRYAYRPGSARGSRAITAQGLFSQQVLAGTLPRWPGPWGGELRRTAEESTAYILLNLPGAEGAMTTDYYYWYYATLALFQAGGDAWKVWNRALTPALLRLQLGDAEGTAAGSWDPIDQRAEDGGRVYSTALSILCLEVYYRYARLETK